MSADGDEKCGDDNVREQDKYLPIANISRIMKRALPHNAKISKDAKEAVQECVSEYISFITSEASDKCQREKRKTINGEDLLWAMSTLGFLDSIETLRAYLHKHRECEGEKAVKSGAQDMSAEGTSNSMAMQLTMVPSMQQGMVPVMPMNYTMAYAPMAPGMQIPPQSQQAVTGSVSPESAPPAPAQGSSESQS